MSGQAPHEFLRWRRHALLVIAIVFLTGGVGLPLVSSSPDAEMLRGLLLKVGIVLFMMWLALPQLVRINPWLLGPTVALGLVAIVRPQLLLVIARVAVPLAPVLFLIWLFWVPKKRSAGR